MGVSYKKLWLMLVEKNMSKADLRRAADISPSTLTKLNKNEYISLAILARIGQALNCDIGDLVERIED
jgi:putative transcriptional regulator